MGTERVNGKELGRCECGNLYTLDNRQDACSEISGTPYVELLHQYELEIARLANIIEILEGQH